MKDLIRASEIISEYERTHSLREEKIEYFICTAQWIIVSTGNSAGMGFHLGGGEPGGEPLDQRLKQYKEQIGRSVSHLLDQVLQEPEDLFRRALAMAAVNCLSCHFDDIPHENKLLPDDFMKKPFDFVRDDDVVTVVGHGNFGGIIDKLYGHCREYHVFEKRDRLFLQNYFVGRDDEAVYPEHIQFHDSSDEEQVLGRSDVVILTGSTFVNNTYRPLIEKSRNARVRAMFGPTAQGPVEFLKEMGLNCVYSCRIRVMENFYKSMRHVGRSCDVSRKDYMMFYQGMLED